MKLNDDDVIAIERLADVQSLTPIARRDRIYNLLVKRAGLYGKAYFGHKASKADRRELNRLHLMAAELVDKANRPKAETLT